MIIALYVVVLKCAEIANSVLYNKIFKNTEKLVSFCNKVLNTIIALLSF